jgi:pimeloyl-ACP methyl ester carboxylesterase
VALTVGSCEGGAAKSDTSSHPTKSRSSANAATLSAFYAQRIQWSSCGGGFQCGSVDVPLDYAHPDAGKLAIKAIRQPAQEPSQRIGSLVINPGGPGGSGIYFAREEAHGFGQEVQKRFDIVGFDPRGVGQSDPIRCLTYKQLDTYLATNSSPQNQQELTTLDDVSRGFAKGCESRSGKILPYVGTANAARDIDILRSALGDKLLTYYGASYGTYLGAYYADEFPKNVRALVLDGAIDPTLSESDLNIEQAKGFETALKAFAANCLSSPNCPIGPGSVDDALAKVSQLIKSTDTKPLASSSGDGRQVDSALTVMGIAAALYSKQTWPILRQGLAGAITQGDGTILLQLSDTLVERNPDGSYSNQTESNMAVNCVDKPYPTTVSTFQQQADQAKKVAPHFGPFVVWGSLPCAYWSVRNNHRPTTLPAAGSPPILVVGTTRDPATPYQWAKNLAAQFKSGVLLSLNGDGHTAYVQGDPCISAAVNRYLTTGQPPANGTVCQ